MFFLRSFAGIERSHWYSPNANWGPSGRGGFRGVTPVPAAGGLAAATSAAGVTPDGGRSGREALAIAHGIGQDPGHGGTNDDGANAPRFAEAAGFGAPVTDAAGRAFAGRPTAAHATISAAAIAPAAGTARQSAQQQ